MVSPNYFKTFGIRLVAGRFLTDADNANSLHVVVVNEEFVRHYMPGKNPIGQTVNIAQPNRGSPKPGAMQPWVIVGEYHDVHGGIFMNQLLKGEPMTIFGDGTQQRAFTHVSDVAPVIAASVRLLTCRAFKMLLT